MNRDQLLCELWAAYGGDGKVIFDAVEVDPVRIVVRGQPDWKDTLGVAVAHIPDPDWGKVESVVPKDIPVRDRVTGNIYYIRVESGSMKLYDVDDALVKKWWEVWK